MSPGLKGRLILGAIVASVALFIGGFVAGQSTVPDKVVEVENKSDRKLSAENDRLKAVNAKLEDSLKVAKRHTVKTTVVSYSPTGVPVSKTTKSDTQVDTTVATHSDASTVVDSAKSIATDSSSTSSKSVTTEQRRELNRLGPMVDFNTKDGRISFGGQYQREILRVPLLNVPLVLGIHILIAPPRSETERIEARVGGSLSGGF